MNVTFCILCRTVRQYWCIHDAMVHSANSYFGTLFMCPKSVAKDVAVAAAPAAKKAEKKTAAQVNGMKVDGVCQCIMHILWHYMYVKSSYICATFICSTVHSATFACGQPS